ncbi:TetR family transcriptional regulator [Mycolicibacterium agri]|uniref:TetR family transcriptional regulator n=1 Tax=Mycolicibacterium agri TaxID=36811 RepID=A0A2A7N5P8_MYCAG|nr:TetR/AcrR family transcriptional regulator [Mycolicibacterium agri]PEG39093.1 TetR family transcriptional regulator [Mycolicibacterium agri]GFG53992.1 TetR family transcriptional regulator [Mycolicibacterium agri]
MTLPARSARKRATILSAGQQLFLANGYQGTSMDQVAATAAVSKQTVYKHFGEKRELLFAIVTDALDTTVGSFGERIAALADSADVEADLASLAGDYLRAVLDESVVQLRRLVIGEANRLPELARLYYQHAPQRTLAALSDAFGRLHQRGLLHAPQPSLAAEHFAFLVVGRPIDQALFDGAPKVLADLDVDTYARAGVDAFLAAYGPR